MKTFAAIIDAFGVPDGPPAGKGVAIIAKALRLDESHVRTMKARNSIPPEYWGALIELADDLGIEGLDYKKFRQLREARFSEQAAS